jgi:raffinose/stachyose/melibiose transport system substrate-binding protein
VKKDVDSDGKIPNASKTHFRNINKMEEFKRSRVILSVFLFIIMLSAMLAGCGQGNQETPPGTASVSSENGEASEVPSTDNVAGKKIVFLTSQRQFPGEEDAWKEIIKDFQNETGATVEYSFQGKWADKVQMLTTAKLANEQVDITTNGGAALNQTIARSGSVMDLTQIAAPLLDRFTESTLRGQTIGGKVWGLPINGVTVCGIFYNADLFKQLGIEIPKTYDEFKNVAAKIKEKGIIPLVQQGKASYYWPMWFMETYAQTTKNKSIESVEAFLSGNKKFTGQEEIQAFKEIKRFFEDGLLDASCLDIDTDSMHAMFIQQKAAMFQGGTWEYAAIVKDCKFEVGVFAFPVMVDGSIEQCGSGADEGYNITSWASQDNLAADMAFLEFITRPENAKKLTDCQTPIATSLKDVPGQDSPIKEYVTSVLMPSSITFLDWIWPAEINDAFEQAIPAVGTGVMTPEEAAASVQKAYDQLVVEKDYSYDWYNKWTKEQWDAVTPKVLPKIVMK